jgi:hypothetical protein
MLINIGAMVVLAIYAYTYGDTKNIYRATDNNQDICGQSGTATANYPYAYFYNPSTMDLTNRVCVTSCPSYSSSGTLSSLTCYSNPNLPSCAYTITVKQDGTYNISRNTTNSDVIGYDSSEQIGRVCIPNTKVLENAFSSFSTSMSNGVRQAGLANFIPDIQNVLMILDRTGDGSFCQWFWQSSYHSYSCSSLDALQAALFGYH